MSTTQQTSSTVSAPAHYIMVGGFLGSGKTTALARLAQWLSQRGRRVGLITNDQGSHLVDTATLSARGFAVEEIPGGCFCCRFNSLVEAAQRLAVSAKPDVFLAEPVGSCTDLVATVSYPLRKLYGAAFSLAPLSVLLDPIRAQRVLGLRDGPSFSDKVVYIYRKQIEEADVLVINKCDLIDSGELARLKEMLEAEFGAKRVFEISARNGRGLEPWFEHIENATQTPRALMDVDYQVYADGEARLGWFNATFRLQASQPVDANTLIAELSGAIQTGLQAAGAEVAHLKMTLEPRTAIPELAVINLVRNDFVPELSQRLAEPFLQAELTINLRAEAEPETLRQTVQSAMDQIFKTRPGLAAEQRHIEAFMPGKPSPTHRVALPVGS